MINSNRKRDISIDILKFFAVFLIINSHMDSCYPPKYSILATGGAIGDVLFLFASGFTLFMGRLDNFPNWYKRRINRIFPSVFVCAMIFTLITWKNSVSIERLWGGQFVIAIMIYYVILYFIRKFCINRIPMILCIVGIISLLVYIFFFPYKYETSSKGMYGISTLYRWIPYFGFMLLGAWMGLRRDKLKSRHLIDSSLFVVSLLLFYGIQLAAKRYTFVAPYQIVTLLPLMGIVFYFYKLCNTKCLERLYYNRYCHPIIMTISGLCLESYLIQFAIITDKFNLIFPANIPLIMLTVLIVSYICKVLSRFFSQTFRDEAYDWKELVKAY